MSEPILDPAPHRASAPVRLALRLADRLHPALACKLAYPVFMHPRHRRLTPRARALLAQARPGRLQLGSYAVRSYSWGIGPIVLLVHGWGGRAGEWLDFVPPLRAAGLRVVAVDLPGHGRTGGRDSDVLRMTLGAARTGHRPGRRRRGHRPFAGRAGQPVCAGRRPAPAAGGTGGLPGRHGGAAAAVHRGGGLSQAARERLAARLVSRLHRPLGSLEADLFKPRVEIPTLVVHDQEDRQIPCLEAQRLVRDWPSARLWLTRGLRPPGAAAGARR